MKRHDAACTVLSSWCEDTGCHPEAGQKSWGEVLVPWAAPARPEAQMDLVIHVPGFIAPFYVDLTVVSALSSDALSGGSAIRSGAAPEMASRGKFRDYPNCNLTPFVIEDHGRLGEEALRLVRCIAPVELAERSKAIRCLHRSLGATLQRMRLSLPQQSGHGVEDSPLQIFYILLFGPATPLPKLVYIFCDGRV